MRFPVYPEEHRKLARFKLRIRYPLLTIFVVGIIMFVIGADTANEALLIAGSLAGACGFLFFATFNAKDSLIWAEIGADGIRILDDKGQAFRSIEYRYVRSIETRKVKLTLSSSESKKGYAPLSGVEVQLIIIYTNGAYSIDDLDRWQLGKNGAEFYYCDELFHHHSCIAFVYDVKAWELLNDMII